MKKIYALVLLLLIGSATLMAQNIKGKVVDENGLGLPGVNILISGTIQGVVTNVDGAYSIKANLGDTLLFSFIGYKSQKLAVSAPAMPLVKMVPDVETMDEVVIIGYGSVRKKDLSSSISTVKSGEITKTSQGNFTKALQGKVAGVQVFNAGGGPGSAPKIVIRGAISLNGTADPMYVVDGIPIGRNANQINQNDIESISILKDASAAAIYGTEASNGVVLITTKKGQMGTTNFELTANFGLQHLKNPGMADAREFMLVHNARAINAGNQAPYSQADIDNPPVDINWWDEVVNKVAPKYDITLGFNGGSKKFRYSGSVGYTGQKSQMDVGKWERYSGRFNTEYHFTDNIKFGQNLYPRVESWKNTPNLWYAIQTSPNTPVLRTNHEQYDRYSKWSTPVNFNQNNQPLNPYKDQELAKVNNSNLEVLVRSNSFLNIRFLKDFVFNTQLGLEFQSNMYDKYNPKYSGENGGDQNQINNVSRETRNYYGFTWNNTLSYIKTVDKVHNFNLMAGFVAQKGKYKQLYGYGEKIPSDDPTLRFIDAATANFSANGVDWIDNALVSVLGRVMYNYDERYFINATVRRDASFKFAENNRAAVFPAVSLAWSAHNEEFAAGINWLSQFKVRAGWGQVGNQDPLSGGTINYTLGKAPYVFGAGRQTFVGYYNNQFGNPDLKWETVEDLSAGIDLGVWKNKVTFTADVFSKRNKDMLMTKAYPYFSGYPNSDVKIWSNIGSLKSNGFELAIGYNDTQGDFTWNVNANLTHIETIADKLAEGETIYAGSWGGPYTTITMEGEKVGQYYGYKTDGLFQNQTEINAHSDEHGNLIQPSARPGDVRFKDLNKDGKIGDGDAIPLGSSGQPLFTTGLNLNAAYKNFDFSMSTYASVGADAINMGKYYWDCGAEGSNVYKGTFDRAWKKEGDNDLPILIDGDPNGSIYNVSDFYLEDADYFKIRYVQLGYTFPKVKGIEYFRVYMNIDNPLTLTNYSGFEPEIHSHNIMEQNLDHGDSYPNPTIFSLGLNIKF